MNKGRDTAVGDRVGISDGRATSCAWSDEQRTAVVEEMSRVLAHPSFKSSKRCVELLQYLVDHALADEEDGIKERTLGIEVFGRSANYDTNTDPIVRRTANEIRKRLAQCYLESDCRHSVRIRLDRGGYLPEFEFTCEDHFPDALQAGRSGESPQSLKLHRSPPMLLKRILESAANVLRMKWILGIAAALLLSSAGFFLIRFDAFRFLDPQYMIWKPLLESNDRITVCLSDNNPLLWGRNAQSSSLTANNVMAFQQDPTAPISQDTPFQDSTAPISQETPFKEMNVGYAISKQLLKFKRDTSLLSSSALTFQDFRQRPVILIGGFNNPWSMIVLSKLRYSLRIDSATHDRWIQDAQNPSKRDWKISGKLKSDENIPNCYGVITRFFDADTGQWIIALSGLETLGTEAAGELLTDPAFARLLPSIVHSKRNFQIVLKALVVNKEPGPIQILAVYTW